MPSSQYGSVGRSGVDFASHVIRCLVAIADVADMSYCVVFLDLSKAFDKVVWEVMLGWPASVAPDRAARVEHLRTQGVSAFAAGWMCDYLEAHGPLLSQREVPEKARTLLRNLA